MILTDLMKEMLQVTLLGSTVYFGKSRAGYNVGSKGKHLFRAYRKDLELISKGEQLPALNSCDTIERLSCLLTASKTEV